MRETKSINRGWGWACILFGLYPIGAALGLLPIAQDGVHAPVWVLFLCGVIFAMGGCMILLGQHSRLNDLFAFVFSLAASTIGAWVALFGSSEQFSGGIPFVPYHINIMLGRILFGVGAIITLGMAAYALHRFRQDS